MTAAIENEAVVSERGSCVSCLQHHRFFCAYRPRPIYCSLAILSCRIVTCLMLLAADFIGLKLYLQ